MLQDFLIEIQLKYMLYLSFLYQPILSPEKVLVYVNVCTHQDI